MLIFFPEIRYGYPGSTEMEVRKEMFDLDAHLQSERFTYAWISSANAEYEEALTQIHFLSNIHAKVLDVKLSSKEIVPEEDANYWIDLVFNNSTSGLTQSLATLNSVIQGRSDNVKSKLFSISLISYDHFNFGYPVEVSFM